MTPVLFQQVIIPELKFGVKVTICDVRGMFVFCLAGVRL